MLEARDERDAALGGLPIAGRRPACKKTRLISGMKHNFASEKIQKLFRETLSNAVNAMKMRCADHTLP